MKITATKESLLAAITKPVKIVESRTTTPILANLKLSVIGSELRITGTDNDVTITGKCNVETEEEGSLTCDAKKLHSIVGAVGAGEVVRIEQKLGHILVKSGRSRFKINTLPVEDFPENDALEFDRQMVVFEATLLDAIINASYAIAKNDVRYYLNGLNFDIGDNVRLVSTDGHRMAVTDIDVDSFDKDSGSFIVPSKTVTAIKNLLDKDSEKGLTLNLTANKIDIQGNDWRITSKLIDGKYPDWSAAIPIDYQVECGVDKKQFMDAIKRVMILSNDKFRGGTLSLSSNELKLTAYNPAAEKAVETIPVDYSGDDFEVAYNLNYLVDAVNNCKGDIVQLNLNGVDSSSKLTGEGDSLNIVMPVRI